MGDNGTAPAPDPPVPLVVRLRADVTLAGVSEPAPAGAIFDLPVGALCAGDDHPPGLHRPHLAALLDGRVVDLRPIEVEPHGAGWRIRNGRHRWARALIAGEPTVRCRLA